MVITKPGRRLGGAWLDDFVAQKKAVNLCVEGNECAKKYGDWHSKRNYSARSRQVLTDCDGCGRELQRCNSYFYSLSQIQ